MKNERNPAYVLGWLTTSANYTVVASSAPPDTDQESVEPKVERVDLEQVQLASPA
jgi:hypothetical protein